ncbi:MAG: hypothetical protein A2X35_10525 [Elusimicrobia bacterium GWA2_61_42]|nr:MAG: hypothetical protein A2X35_10525 [Elusimicrobia bacterium GWA2_61_42]OGR74695.1 MAG: hypothetical protein A2X38_02490 [Elusimicrobia bacterium GWC2_61_25]
MCLAAAGLLVAAPVLRAAPPRRPSVVLVILDAVRADRTSPYGYDKAATPALGALAARSFVFENAYANSNWTGASFASILTGLRPFAHGLVGRLNTLSQENPTIQSLLAQNGYETAAFFTGLPGEAAYGLSRGFSHVAASEGERPFSRQVADALEWKNKLAPGEDFFILLHGNDAHYPYRCSPDQRTSDGDFPEINREFIRDFNAAPDGGPDQPAVKDQKGALAYRENPAFLSAVSDAYDQCVSREDTAVAALLHGLEAPPSRPVLVIVTADHGTYLGEHGLLGHGRHYFEQVARVPLLIRFPDGRKARRIRPAAEHADLLPTICAAAGIGCPRELDGQDLSSAFESPEKPRQWAAAGDVGDGPGSVIRSAAFSRNGKKLVLSGRRWRLYDLAADPGETADITRQRPEVFLDLAAGYLAFSGAAPVIRNSALAKALGDNCLKDGGAGPGRQEFKLRPGPGVWKMTGRGFSAAYGGEKGFRCEDEKGRPVAGPGCAAPAMALLNCVERHRFADREKSGAEADKLQEALKKAGYVP